MRSLKLLNRLLTTPRQTLMLSQAPYPGSTPEKLGEDCSSLKESLQGAEEVVYEARNDSTGNSFMKNGKREWVPVAVTKRGGEMSARELEGYKRIAYFEEKDKPYLSIQGKFQFSTPIAKRTRSQLNI